MEKETRGAIERATQQARRLLEAEYAEQLEGTYDVLLNGKLPASPGPHLDDRQRLERERIVAAVRHKEASDMTLTEGARRVGRPLR
jgi:hypothetical protein